MKIYTLIIALIFQLSVLPAVSSDESPEGQPVSLPVAALVGETLSYNVSFLWFKRIARGEIRLEAGETTGTYLATLTARTRGTAAFFSNNRVETYSTLMEEGPDGLLRPLFQRSDTQKGKQGQETHRQTSYTFDFANQSVTYEKSVNGTIENTQELEMEENVPIYDFLTAFYNLRLGRLGAFVPGRDIKLSAFSRKGPEEIVISSLIDGDHSQLKFSEGLMLCKVLMSPETFKTDGSDIYVGFDELFRPQLAVVKNVIGLGDVRGELVNISSSLH